MSHIKLLLLAITLTLLFSGCVISPEIRSLSLDLGGHHGRLQLAIGQDDRALINNYYQGRHQHQHKNKKRKGMPPGLAKKKRLPPGLHRQLEKNGELPPGLQGRHLPLELERQLSALPKGYVRLRVGSDIVIINEQSRVIVDLMLGISL